MRDMNLIVNRTYRKIILGNILHYQVFQIIISCHKIVKKMIFFKIIFRT